MTLGCKRQSVLRQGQFGRVHRIGVNSESLFAGVGGMGFDRSPGLRQQRVAVRRQTGIEFSESSVALCLLVAIRTGELIVRNALELAHQISRNPGIVRQMNKVSAAFRTENPSRLAQFPFECRPSVENRYLQST